MNFILAVSSFALLGLCLGGLLSLAQKIFRVEGNPKVDEIENLLPGGQCGQCGEAGCRQAAQAMVDGMLSPDQCPPGGRALASSIAQILGVELAGDDHEIPLVAYIDEPSCSGCGRCFKACPFDAIVGANKQMHTVMASVCTGCRLCEKSCQQGCLTLQPLPNNVSNWLWPKPQVA